MVTLMYIEGIVDTCTWIFIFILWDAGNRRYLLVENDNYQLIFREEMNNKKKVPKQEAW